ncbi:MAG: DedA family protein [Myxococcales bacterium]|nr:DedA family protein [Myxococcales bacterium]
MLEEIIAYLEETRGPGGYLVLVLAGMVEYLFPPLPGDTLAIVGVVLAATAGYSPWLVHAALTAGAVLGGQTAYAFGRWIATRRERSPRFLHGEATERALDEVRARFERHGAAYLLVNRFLPALRAFFFVGAGLSRMNAWEVALYGGLSAAAWNGLLLAAGWAVGSNVERLQVFLQQYTWGAFAVIGVVLVVFFWRRRRARRADAGSEVERGDDQV